MTFVKTKLLIEEMAVNDVAEVRLQGREPLANIPQSIKEFGHQIISLHPENCKEDKYGIHRLRIKKVI